MKELLKVTLLMASMLALVLLVRVAAFTHVFNEATAVMDPSPIAATDKRCAAQQVKFPCLQSTDRRS